MLKPMRASTALPAALVQPPGTLKTGLLPSAGQGAGSAAADGEKKGDLPNRPDLPDLPDQPDDFSDDLFELFDLRHLGTPSRHMPGGPVIESSQLDNPFGVLDIAGAERRPAGDALAELLGQLPPVAATPAVSYADSIDAAQHDAARATPVDLLLTDLHAEFVRVVRDPAQLTGRIDWDSVASSSDEPPPTLDQLSQLAGPYRLLRDILQPCEGIDRIIANFDSLNPSTLLGNTETEEVLRLFAPRLAQGGKVAVPGLTRREHHDLSPDSPMNLGAFAPDDKAAR